jgi:hypothetical protein
MLRIGKQQLEEIDRAVDESYTRDLARYLREEHADAVRDLPDAELLRRVKIGIDRAEAHGMTWDSAISAFVAIMFEVSPTFDEIPAIAAVLADERVPADTRIDQLWDRTSDEDWDEAERRAEHAETFWKSAGQGVELGGN